jgi:hypothetical protein
MSAYVKNTERSQINDLMLHLKLLVKQQQVKPKISRKRKIRAEINKIETKKTKQKTNETKNWFFEKIIKLTILQSI